MDIFKIRYEPQAKQDILKIKFYITYILLNSKASKNFSNGMINTILNLERFPYIGKVYLNNQIRYLIYKNFYIFYEIQEKERIIYIKRIIHKNTVTF